MTDQHADAEGFSRRSFLAVGGSAVAAPVVFGTPEAKAAPPRRTRGGGDVRLREGTDFSVQSSPDGRRLAIDLLGVLWVLPASGGPARRLTGDLFDIGEPDWSPDGERLAFQSYRDGGFNLWTVRADGSQLRQLTQRPYDHREPRFSPDGRFLAYSSDAGGSYGIYTYDLSTGVVATIADTSEEEYEPAWSPDGTKLAFVVTNTAIDVVDVASGARETVVTAAADEIIHAPAWTPDGNDVVYNLRSGDSTHLMISGEPLVDDEEVFPFRVTWLDGDRFVYSADGRIRQRSLSGGTARTIGFSAAVTVRTPTYRKRRRDFESGRSKPVRGIGSPVLSPDGKHVAFRALNDIYTMRIGRRPRPLTGDHWWKSHPAWSPDGRSLAYSSDRGGTLDLWLRDLETGADRQLTDLADLAAVSASWSPDGTQLAFLDQTGALHTVEVASGDVQLVYPATFEPGRPTWSPDGNVIAMAAVVPYSARFREGLSKILLVNRTTGEARYVDPMPHRSIQTRGDDGPVWSPDGTMLAFVVGNLAYVLPVDPDGSPTGEARPVTSEVTDAVSWSGDSTRLLYLNNGRLRLVHVDGGQPRTVPVRLTWTNQQPRGRTVIRAGRMWDGTSDRLRDDVDIVVEGQRITAVEPHRDGRDGHRIDARDSVVIPGLIDMHHHREMQGYEYGDRQGRLWLSLGVTTTRSPGSPAYHMVEDRESVQSGARIAPRYFGTGEAVDGPRIYYNFMRPTVDTDQLAMELERAGALDYDLMKAYVRLPPAWQRRVIDFAHGRRIHASSHYHYPAFAFGSDGMEHTGATNRFGYSRTVTALGTGYDDVIDIFNVSKAVRTPTLFGATTLYREDLQGQVEEAKTTDQTVARANLRRQVRQAIDMMSGGGRVITGTDSPIANNAMSLHMNLRAMVRYGVSPLQALVSATSESGRFLGEPIGRVAPGMYADLTVLGGDPLTDIRAAADVRRVLVGGVAYTVGDLLAPYTEAAATRSPAPPRNRILAPVPQHASSRAFWWHDPEYVAEARHSCCVG
jgi:Tol biopolymer transport system component